VTLAGNFDTNINPNTTVPPLAEYGNNGEVPAVDNGYGGGNLTFRSVLNQASNNYALKLTQASTEQFSPGYDTPEINYLYGEKINTLTWLRFNQYTSAQFQKTNLDNLPIESSYNLKGTSLTDEYSIYKWNEKYLRANSNIQSNRLLTTNDQGVVAWDNIDWVNSEVNGQDTNSYLPAYSNSYRAKGDTLAIYTINFKGEKNELPYNAINNDRYNADTIQTIEGASSAIARTG
jgi:hypothetical protein